MGPRLCRLNEKNTSRATLSTTLLFCPGPFPSMHILLAPRLCLHRRALKSTSLIPQWRRSCIHFWHCVHQNGLPGQTKLLDYQEAAVPDIGQREIRFWKGSKYLGIFPVQQILDDYMGPGRMLSIKSDPLKSERTPTQDYDYEPEPLKHALELAFKFLERGNAKFPVEFHIKSKKVLSHADLSLLTNTRLDLHPAVILRSLPEDVHQIVKPHVDIQAGDAVWVVSRPGLRVPGRNEYLSKSPDKMVKQVEEMITQRRASVENLIDAGELTRDGKMVKQVEDMIAQSRESVEKLIDVGELTRDGKMIGKTIYEPRREPKRPELKSRVPPLKGLSWIRRGRQGDGDE
ncbi:hypothetical protein N8I77_011329 [Diaporthe amygdali]|uniref:Uncharacterized protein n=1 Tax=Phomopsis amygdali TaxID=1214568 RepID=A0AAD9S849_PHOAM|nr:hypothetical protein N8I77_011329 [Diaporthe amygdali]